MSNGNPEAVADAPDDQPQFSPPVLEYHLPPRQRGAAAWLRRVPRLSWTSLLFLLLTGAAAIWVYSDHEPWAVVSEFTGNLPENAAPQTISPDGRQLLAILTDATFHHRAVRIYDIATGKTIRDLQQPSGDVLTAWFSPDGSRVLSFGGDGTAILWNAANGQRVASLPELGAGEAFWNASPFSSDGLFWRSQMDRAGATSRFTTDIVVPC